MFTQELGPATETWLPEIDDVDLTEAEVRSVEDRTNNIPLTSIMPLAMEMALKIENRQRSNIHMIMKEFISFILTSALLYWISSMSFVQGLIGLLALHWNE